MELIAPAVGGVETTDGQRVPADQKIDGGPSVLYDAVVVLASEPGARDLAMQPAARDFISDAYAHYKFVGYAGDPTPLFVAAGIGGLMDDGFISLKEHSAADFIARCAELRYWPRAMARDKMAAGARA